jgi:uncharacterized protein
MNRIYVIQSKLLEEIAKQMKRDIERDYPLAWEQVHMVSCSKIGQLLAIKRRVDPEMAAIACVLHDYGRIITGRQANHAHNGYLPLKDLLNEYGLFTAEEIEILAQAAKNHSSKQKIGTEIEEIVKDADVLDCYQYGQTLERPEQRDRLAAVLAELGI